MVLKEFSSLTHIDSSSSSEEEQYIYDLAYCNGNYKQAIQNSISRKESKQKTSKTKQGRQRGARARGSFDSKGSKAMSRSKSNTMENSMLTAISIQSADTEQLSGASPTETSIEDDIARGVTEDDDEEFDNFTYVSQRTPHIIEDLDSQSGAFVELVKTAREQDQNSRRKRHTTRKKHPATANETVTRVVLPQVGVKLDQLQHQQQPVSGVDHSKQVKHKSADEFPNPQNLSNNNDNNVASLPQLSMYGKQQHIEPIGYISPQRQVFNVIFTDQNGQPLQFQQHNMQLHSFQKTQFQQLQQVQLQQITQAQHMQMQRPAVIHPLQALQQSSVPNIDQGSSRIRSKQKRSKKAASSRKPRSKRRRGDRKKTNRRSYDDDYINRRDQTQPQYVPKMLHFTNVIEDDIYDDSINISKDFHEAPKELFSDIVDIHPNSRSDNHNNHNNNYNDNSKRKQNSRIRISYKFAVESSYASDLKSEHDSELDAGKQRANKFQGKDESHSVPYLDNNVRSFDTTSTSDRISHALPSVTASNTMISHVSTVGDPFVMNDVLIIILGIGEYDSGLPNLDGVKKDYENIINTFVRYWKYKVLYMINNSDNDDNDNKMEPIYTNDMNTIDKNRNYKLYWTCDDIDLFVEQARKHVVQNQHNGMIFVISSHGDTDNIIYDSNIDEYELNDIFKLSSPEWSSMLESYKETQTESNHLFQIPKIFCIDCCRGDGKAQLTKLTKTEEKKDEKKDEKDEAGTETNGDNKGDEKFVSKGISKYESKIHSSQMANFCKLWANVEGFSVADGSENGGLFLRNICKIFKDRKFTMCHKWSDIIIKIRENTKRDASLIGTFNFTQLVENEDTLEKPIIFLPFGVDFKHEHRTRSRAAISTRDHDGSVGDSTTNTIISVKSSIESQLRNDASSASSIDKRNKIARKLQERDKPDRVRLDFGNNW